MVIQVPTCGGCELLKAHRAGVSRARPKSLYLGRMLHRFLSRVRPRPLSTAAGPTASTSRAPNSSHKIVRTLLSYVWPSGHPALRARVLISLSLLVGGKLLSIQVPFLFKGIADDLEMRVRGRAGSVESRDGDNAPPEDAIASAAAIGAAVSCARCNGDT